MNRGRIVLQLVAVSVVTIRFGNGFSISNNRVSKMKRTTPLSLFFTPDRPDNNNQNKNNNKNEQLYSSSNDGGNIQKDHSNHQVPHNSRYSQLEFKDLEPLPENNARRLRIERELEVRSQFEEFGDKLWELRSEMDALSNQLISAIEGGHDDLRETTSERLREMERRDPDLVYQLTMAECERAIREGRVEDSKLLSERAMQTRSCLPQFNLDGLWVGKYGNRYELINVTYIGDILIAEKVTGDNNVPKGEITFQVDLNPLRNSNRNYADGSRNDNLLQPIQLTDKAAKKWGTKKLPRYGGLGQVAEAGFQNNQWLDGQLILIGNDYFSFAWLPIEQQIFFGRPSPELALKMVREASGQTIGQTNPSILSTSKQATGALSMDDHGEDADTEELPPPLDSNLAVLKQFAMKCLDKTHEVEDELDSESLSGSIWYSSADNDMCYFE
jgi:Cyclin D1 binding domain